MRRDEFETWLRQHYLTDKGTVMDSNARSSRISNCIRVKQFEGDLDDHHRKDAFTSLLKRLVYLRQDEARNTPQRHSIPIDGNTYNGTATLRGLPV